MIANLLKALKAGHSLSDPVKWKRGQWLSNAVSLVLLGVITLIKIKFPEFELSDKMMEYLVETVVGVLLMANLVLIPATTETMGTKDGQAVNDTADNPSTD